VIKCKDKVDSEFVNGELGCGSGKEGGFVVGEL